jgi:hypothetical protein
LDRRTKRRKLNRIARFRLERSIERTEWILGIPTSDKSQRGLQAELKVLESLEYLKKKKIEFPGGRRIKSIEPAGHFSQKDQEGRDALVTFQTNSQSETEVLSIQIKDWWMWRTENNFRKKGICLIAIWPNEDKKKARKRVFEALWKWFS